MRRVVILGGGYAGLHAYSRLRAELSGEIDRDEVDLVLISRDPYHTYHGWTGEVLNGDLPVESTLTPLVPILGADFVQGEAVSADLERNMLAVSIGGVERDFPFDHLVIAAGSTDPFDRIAGLEEHGWCVKNSRDMQKLVAELDRWVGAPARPRNIVVVGGGLAGVETASALAARFSGAAGSINVHLVSSSTELLPSLRPDFSRIANKAVRALEEQGVQIHSGLRVSGIHGDHVALADGTSLLSDMTVVAAGVSFATLPGTESLARNPSGQLVTERTLQVRGRDNIWAAGDIAAVAHPVTAGPCPANALWAMKEGACAGRNVARAIKGRALRPFSFRGMGQTAGLAGQRGITELYGVQFSGRLAWIIRALFFAWYMPSQRRAFPILFRLSQQLLVSLTGVAAGSGARPDAAGADAEPVARRL